jgi:hypothetical protein
LTIDFFVSTLTNVVTRNYRLQDIQLEGPRPRAAQPLAVGRR